MRREHALAFDAMQINDAHLNTTAFLCVERQTEAGLAAVPSATVFFIADIDGTRPFPVWAVTARHCIAEARAARKPTFVRINAGDSFVDVPTEPDDWHESDEADVACLYWANSEVAPQSVLPLGQLVDENYCYRFGKYAFDPEDDGKHGDWGDQTVYLGAEIAFLGLFSQHAGTQKNLPVARFGALARLPQEPITVKRPDGSRESIEGYLVEARSWGGASGSPVFWAHPFVKVVELNPPVRGNRAQRRAAERGPRQTVHASSEEQLITLLGLVSGHFDIPQEATTTGDILGKIVTDLNAGMAVVTPAHFIRRLIDREDVREEANEYREQWTAEPAATVDVIRMSDQHPATKGREEG